jgi:hypothetical protein
MYLDLLTPNGLSSCHGNQRMVRGQVPRKVESAMGRKLSAGIKVTPPKPLPRKPLGGLTRKDKTQTTRSSKTGLTRLTTEGVTPFEDVLDRKERR